MTKLGEVSGVRAHYTVECTYDPVSVFAPVEVELLGLRLQHPRVKTNEIKGRYDL